MESVIGDNQIILMCQTPTSTVRMKIEECILCITEWWIEGWCRIKGEEWRMMNEVWCVFGYCSFDIVLWATTFLWTYFLFGTYNFFKSASDLLLWFGFLGCNCAVLMRASSARIVWGLFFFFLLTRESNVNFWTGLGVWQYAMVGFNIFELDKMTLKSVGLVQCCKKNFSKGIFFLNGQTDNIVEINVKKNNCWYVLLHINL